MSLHSIIDTFQIKKELYLSLSHVYLHFLCICGSRRGAGRRRGKHKRDDCKVCGRSIGRKSGVYCPLARIAASNVKGGRVDDGNVFLQSGGTRFISDRIKWRILPPSLISLCSTCHATNNNLVKGTVGIPTRVWSVSIVEERFLGDCKMVS